MGYRCGCGAEFDNKKEWVAHMVNAHNSPFLEGDKDLIDLSIKESVKSGNENALRKLRDNDLIDAQNKKVVA